MVFAESSFGLVGGSGQTHVPGLPQGVVLANYSAELLTCDLFEPVSTAC